MSVAIVTGSAGFIGSEACQKWHDEGFDVIGIDNDMRAEFFGRDASTIPAQRLEATLRRYRHHEIDIRDAEAVEAMFRRWAPLSRSSSTPPRSRRTTGPRASRTPISASTPSAR